MSYVIAAPELVAAAAADVAGIGSSLSAAHAAAAGPTTAVVAAAEDEVSAAVASLFSGHARQFQALSAQAAAFHADFVQALTSAGGRYASAEAANASPLQAVEQNALAAVNAPTEALLGRPLIGNGANATTRDGQRRGWRDLVRQRRQRRGRWARAGRRQGRGCRADRQRR